MKKKKEKSFLSRFNIFKKNKDEMISEEQLISYKQNFTSQKFQWIKTDKPDLIGKIVKCKDITPRGIVIFDDGSTVPVKDLNRNLMMIYGDSPPLDINQVKSINDPFNNKNASNLPQDGAVASDAAQNQKIIDQMVNEDPNLAKMIEKDKENAKRVYGESGARMEAKQTAHPTQPQNKVPTANPFEMFQAEESDFPLKVKTKLPNKKLLKMMYSSAENKEEFINQLSSYITSMINNKVVSESLTKMFTPSTKRKGGSSTGIKLTEVKDD